MKLTTKARAAIPTSKFALPGKRAYPLPNVSHARAALSDVARVGTPAQKATVRAKVKSAFPTVGSLRAEKS